jgi:hypothetical protein
MAAATPARLRTIDQGTVPTDDLNALEITPKDPPPVYRYP